MMERRPLALALGQPYDAMVLDLNLPRRDGLRVLRQLRASGRATPVLIRSARGQADDRIAGLNLGADDYLPKLFSMNELLARFTCCRLSRTPPPRSSAWQ